MFPTKTNRSAFTFFITLAFLITNSIVTFAQKVEREYYPNLRVKYEWQVNSTGVKDGYFKSFATDGKVYEKGFYTNGKKSGVWTSYGIMQGFPAEIASTMEYDNDKMNGRYIQYCWNQAKRYICGDYIYKAGEEVKALTYHENGNLQYKRDRENGIYEEFFLDGTPKKETKDGKRYTYDKSYRGKYVSSILFDSLNHAYRYTFSDDHKLSSIDIYEKSDKCIDCGEKIIQYGFSNLSKPNAYKGNTQLKLDSLICFNAYSFYKNSPNPNNKKESCPYDFQTGDIKIISSDSNSYYLIHYFPSNNENISTSKQYDLNNNIIRQTVEENKEVKEANKKNAEKEFEAFYIEYQKKELDSLKLFTSNYWSTYKPINKKSNEIENDYYYPTCHPVKGEGREFETCIYCIYYENNNHLTFFNPEDIELIESQASFYYEISKLYLKMRYKSPEINAYLNQINPIKSKYNSNKELLKNRIELKNNYTIINELNKENKKKSIFKLLNQLYTEESNFINNKTNQLNDRILRSKQLITITERVITLYKQEKPEIEEKLKNIETIDVFKSMLLEL